MNLLFLIKQQQERSIFKDKILAAIHEQYNVVNKDDVVARESATAGNLYAYLSVTLNIPNSTKFQRAVKTLLIEEGLVKPVFSFGRMWLKGLVAKDNAQDLSIANTVIQQHYKDRQAYRERQRVSANKRYQNG